MPLGRWSLCLVFGWMCAVAVNRWMVRVMDRRLRRGIRYASETRSVLTDVNSDPIVMGMGAWSPSSAFHGLRRQWSQDIASFEENALAIRWRRHPRLRVAAVFIATISVFASSAAAECALLDTT